jgi:uncharacterized repeat protein (TIGR03803 family)
LARVLAGDRRLCVTLLVILALSAWHATALAAVSVLHEFLVDPKTPAGGVVRGSDGNFYGATREGGAFNRGTVFRITPSGTITIRHSFNGGPTDGDGPNWGLVEDPGSPGVFYGTTLAGGATNDGTVFKMDAAGAVTVLHSFQYNVTTNGGLPNGGLILASDGKLYGTTYAGGVNGEFGGAGTVFRINTDGTNFTFYSLGGTAGSYPLAGLTQGLDGNFYGTTSNGGSFSNGAVFRVDGSGINAPLHSFNPSEGYVPYASLVEDLASPGTFYGALAFGGPSSQFFCNGGSVFKVTTSGGFSLLHAFDQCVGTAERYPYALVRAGDGTLYGATQSGGAADGGAVFSMTSSGGSYLVVHPLNSATEGSNPVQGLILASDGNLWSTTQYNGPSGRGSVFKVNPAGTGFTAFPFPGTEGNNPLARVIQATDGNFYGTTQFGGTFNQGSVFKMTPAGAVTLLHSFNSADGDGPTAGLIQGTDGNLYGTTETGGSCSSGTLFKLTLAGTLTVLHHFSNGSGEACPLNDGYSPRGDLVQGADGDLYGVTLYGGTSGYGTVFKVNTTGTTYQMLHSFDFSTSSGAYPNGLVQGAAGEFFGTTQSGGASFNGTVFKIGTTPDSLVTLGSFADLPPAAALLRAADGSFYGVSTTSGGGDAAEATPQSLASDSIFRITTNGTPGEGTTITTLYSFPAGFVGLFAPLIQASDGNFYGVTAYDGVNQYGTLFKMTTDGTPGGTTVTTLHEFNPATDGFYPQAALLQASDAKLYGTTFGDPYNGGPKSGGVVFSFDAGLTPPGGGGEGFTATTSINAVGQGVTTTIVISGDDLAQFKFTGTGADSTIDFGPGITIVSMTQSADRKTLTVKIKVAANAPTGLRDIVIRKGSGEGAQTFTLTGALAVNAAPTVTSAGTGADGTGPLLTSSSGVLKSQTVVVKGANFEAPTTIPSNLIVSFSGTGITVNSVGFDGDSQLSVNVDVAGGASTTARKVTVTNPDLGTTTTATAILAMQVAGSDVPVGLAPTATSGTATLPPAPTVTGIAIPPKAATTSPAASIGTAIKIVGTKFSATAANNIVTFAGPANSRVPAQVTSATSTALTVQVPVGATDGPVIVAVSGVQQVPPLINFVVTNPILSSVSVAGGPAAAQRGGAQVTLDLFGAKFQTASVVSLNPSNNLTLGPVSFIDATHLQVRVTAGAGAALGFREVKVTNPDNAFASLPSAFAVNGALVFSIDGDVAAVGTFLPTVNGVTLTLDATSRCTNRTITPTVHALQATFTDPSPPDSLTFTLTSSARPGTATNDDCEPGESVESDFSIGVEAVPPVSSQSVTVGPNGNIYTVNLASWDWGGNVQIDVTDPSGAIVASLSLPVNGVPNGLTKFAADGLTNFEKYRGVYLVAPAPGTTGDLLPENHHRLDATVTGPRNLFVRGRGFAGDPTLQSGQCGVNSLTGAVQPQDPSVPCPAFQLGSAFQAIVPSVLVWDVTASFSADGTTVFPTTSFADPTKPMLDLATVTYDPVNCSGGAACDHTTKLGPRQWNFPTLGFSAFGTCNAFPCQYGKALVLGKALKAYFLDRTYQQGAVGSPAGSFEPTPGPLGAMLAPITTVCDRSTTGSDNGTVQTGECSANGTLLGDVYTPGVFNLASNRMSAMDVNNDGCVELPFVADPLTLSACDPTAPVVPPPSPQATFQQVVRSVTTHELGHAVGINVHTSEVTDLMYQYSINWIRDSHFSGQAGALIQIHNKGQQ